MILITGGTGHIGSEVVRLLSQAGVPTRALAHNPDKGQKLPGITWMAGDLAKPETLPAVFDDCTKLFLLTGNVENATELQHNAIAAARQAGVAHLVKLSAFGRLVSLEFPHRPLALSDRKGAAGIRVGVDDAPAAPFLCRTS